MRDRGPRPFVLLGAVIVAAFAIWFFFIRDDSDGSGAPAPTQINKAHIVDQAQLQQFAGSVGHEVYWAGPQAGAKLELTNTSDGRVYVRYLTGDAQAGDPRPAFLTVGTYPVKDALAALEKGTASGYTQIPISNGGIAVYSDQQPSSVHFAYPSSNYEVEVFDPSPQKAIELVTKGTVQPIG